MTITNPFLEKCQKAYEQIFVVLEDLAKPAGDRAKLIPDAKTNLEKLQGMIAAEVKAANDEGIRTEAIALITEQAERFQDISKFLAEALKTTFTEEQQAQAKGVELDAGIAAKSVAPATSTPPLSDFAQRLSEGLSAASNRHIQTPAVKPLTTTEVLDWDQNSGEGFFVVGSRSVKFFPTEEALAAFIKEHLGSEMPVIVKGVRVIPQVTVSF